MGNKPGRAGYRSWREDMPPSSPCHYRGEYSKSTSDVAIAIIILMVVLMIIF